MRISDHVASTLPKLYGIEHTNRHPKDLWGKNQFNSSFPAALACYMRDRNVPAVYLQLNQHLTVECTDLPVNQLFNTDRPNHELSFHFETKYQPYAQYALDDVGGIDLIVKHHGDNTDQAWRRALEIKLCVTPDNTTCRKPEADWSPELVIRPATTKYCALGMFHACQEHRPEIRGIFEDVCGNFQAWNSSFEVLSKRSALVEALNQFQSRFQHLQQPFLMQPIWKTQGKKPVLADRAFDIFVWSDFALCRAFIRGLESGNDVSRFVRAAARLARMLYALATQGRANLATIYLDMPLGKQTDKEFSLPGQVTRFLMASPRRAQPALEKEAVTGIILNGGERLLSPERRFDASVFFTTKELFDIERAKEETVKALVESENKP